MLDKHRVKRYIFALLVIMLTVLHSLIYLVSAVSLLGGFHREDFSVYIFLFLLIFYKAMLYFRGTCHNF